MPDEHHKYTINYPVLENLGNIDVSSPNTAIILHVNYLIDDFAMLFDKDFKQTLTGTSEITLKTNKYLSIKWLLSQMMDGAAYPNNSIASMTINLDTGRPIELGNLFKDGTDYIGTLNKILLAKIEKEDLPLMSEFRGIEGLQSFYLTDMSLVIYYSEGQYTPHAVGALEFRIPFSQLANIMK